MVEALRDIMGGGEQIATTRIEQILLGEIRTSTPSPEGSVLEHLESHSMKGFPDWNSTVFLPYLTGSFALLSVEWLVQYLGIFDSFYPISRNEFPIFTAVFFFLTFVWYLVLSFRLHSQVSQFYTSFDEAVAELQVIDKKLNEHLHELDQRTNRYFHCVTKSKIRHYFVLGQIRNTLQAFNQETQELLSYGTPDTLLLVCRRLLGTLTITDGVIQGTGKRYKIPLHRLPSTIATLREDLESGLRSVEAEIEEHRKLSHSSPSADPSLASPSMSHRIDS